MKRAVRKFAWVAVSDLLDFTVCYHIKLQPRSFPAKIVERIECHTIVLKSTSEIVIQLDFFPTARA